MKKILVVEDEKDIQNIIKAFLENAILYKRTNLI